MAMNSLNFVQIDISNLKSQEVHITQVIFPFSRLKDLNQARMSGHRNRAVFDGFRKVYQLDNRKPLKATMDMPALNPLLSLPLPKFTLS
jgi:hypothetical protein